MGATALLVGAAATSGLFVLIGFAGHWLYGLIYLLLAAIGLALFPFRLDWVGRLLLPRFRWLEFGWMLGTLPMLAAALLVSLLVVAPIAGERGDRARQRDAERALAFAEQSIAEGDLRRARQHVGYARQRDLDAAALERASSGRNLAAAEERRSRRRYAGAIADFEDDGYRTAIGNLDALGDYRDAARLARRYREIASRRFLAKAHRAYDPAPEGALAIAREADRFRSTRATRRLVADSRAQLVALRRERARQRRIAAAERRAAREYRAQLRRERRQAEREAERQAAAPPSDYGYDYDDPAGGGGKGAPCDNGWTVNWCGASRDGDSDGCWCEK